ncbi:MAG: hypothetical protein RDV41_04455 [Planctomycetota bacterium]|nr:hypothetical protein [Planctomycetota bacterium]
MRQCVCWWILLALFIMAPVPAGLARAQSIEYPPVEKTVRLEADNAGSGSDEVQDPQEVFDPVFSFLSYSVPRSDSGAPEETAFSPIFSRGDTTSRAEPLRPARIPVSRASLRPRSRPAAADDTAAAKGTNAAEPLRVVRVADDHEVIRREFADQIAALQEAVAESRARLATEEEKRSDAERAAFEADAARIAAEEAARQAAELRTPAQEGPATGNAQLDAQAEQAVAEAARLAAEEKARAEEIEKRERARKDFEDFCAFKPNRQWSYSRADGAVLSVRISTAAPTDEGTLFSGSSVLRTPGGQTSVRSLKWLYSEKDLCLYALEPDGAHPLLMFPVEPGLAWSWSTGDVEILRNYETPKSGLQRAIIVVTISRKRLADRTIEYSSRQRHVAGRGLESVEVSDSMAKRYEMNLLSVMDENER